MEENNGGPTEIDESQEEIETVSPMGEGADTGGQFGNNVTQEETEGVPEYLVAAGSAYPCSSPGYFALSGSCREFWVCKEVRVLIPQTNREPFQTEIPGGSWPSVSGATVPVSQSLPL